MIDEQHRFGVEQRAALRDKSAGDAVPDVLVMTATPIPRTAAMTVYGDLDVSVLDELPPGRTPIATIWARRAAAGEPDEAEVWAAVRDEVAAGRQAYVVCPLIEESEKLEVRSAEETFERAHRPTASSPACASACCTAGCRRPRRRRRWRAFRAGRARRAGGHHRDRGRRRRAQRHGDGDPRRRPLRHRPAPPAPGPGRAAAPRQSYVLPGRRRPPRPTARSGSQAMVRTTDGFELAEVDLDLRGEGTIMGERQKGRNDLKLASLRRDREWVVQAREVAFELVDDDPTLAAHPLLAEEVASSSATTTPRVPPQVLTRPSDATTRRHADDDGGDEPRRRCTRPSTPATGAPCSRSTPRWASRWSSPGSSLAVAWNLVAGGLLGSLGRRLRGAGGAPGPAVGRAAPRRRPRPARRGAELSEAEPASVPDDRARSRRWKTMHPMVRSSSLAQFEPVGKNTASCERRRRVGDADVGRRSAPRTAGSRPGSATSRPG